MLYFIHKDNETYRIVTCSDGRYNSVMNWWKHHVMWNGLYGGLPRGICKPSNKDCCEETVGTLHSLLNRPLQLVRFVAPFQTTWCSLEIYSFVSFKINYSYARKYLRIWKQWFSRVPSRGLKWGNKTYKLKRSILMSKSRARVLIIKDIFIALCLNTHMNNQPSIFELQLSWTQK